MGAYRAPRGGVSGEPLHGYGKRAVHCAGRPALGALRAAPAAVRPHRLGLLGDARANRLTRLRRDALPDPRG